MQTTLSPISAADTLSSKSDAFPELLYILSPSYSGSTLLTFMLATHPGIATIGELKASSMGDIAEYHCSCGALLLACPFWTRVQTEMRRHDPDFTLADFQTHFRKGKPHFRKLINLAVTSPTGASLSALMLNLLPDCRATLARMLQRNEQLIRVISQIQGGRVFLDGSKDPERLTQFLRRFGNKVKVVHLIRDGRGVTNSYRKHYNVGMDVAVRECLRTYRRCENVMKFVPRENALSLRYEDFCRNPDESLGKIFDLVKLERTPANRRTEPADFHILGNAMRLSFGKPINLDEKWKRELKPEDLEIFEAIGGNLNREYGYS